MAKECEICHRGPQFGKTHQPRSQRHQASLECKSAVRRALVNGASRRMRVCTACIRGGKVQKVA